MHCRVKFGAFYEYLEREHGGSFDRIASGHYARVLRDGRGGARLGVTQDAVKDQTYFLASLSQAQLGRAMFPLGPLTKVLLITCFSMQLLCAIHSWPPNDLQSRMSTKSNPALSFGSQDKLTMSAAFQAEVRRWAAELGLPNQARPDSQGICFLGKVRFADFLRRHLGTWPGAFLEAESGEVVGYHEGFWFYTLGQRKGIHLSGGPW